MKKIEQLQKQLFIDNNGNICVEGLPSQQQMFDKINEIVNFLNQIIDQQQLN